MQESWSFSLSYRISGILHSVDKGPFLSVVVPCVADCYETVKLDIAFSLFIEH